MQYRPITFQMANTLQLVITTNGEGTAYVERDVEVLVRRNLLVRVEEGSRHLRITQLGRETLAQHLWNQNNRRTRQPSIVTRCSFWRDPIYGLQAQVHYQDDSEPVQLQWTQQFDDDCRAFRFLL